MKRMNWTTLMGLSLMIGLAAGPATPAWARNRGRGSTVTKTTPPKVTKTPGEFSGKIESIRQSAREIALRGTGSNPEVRTFSVDGATPIAINGQRSLFGQIRVGDRASVSFETHEHTPGKVVRSGGRGKSSSRSSGKPRKDGGDMATALTVTR